MMVDELLRYARETYKTLPDFPWKDRQGGMVLRHGDSGKWYGLIFTATRRQLGIGETEERVDILNATRFSLPPSGAVPAFCLPTT